MLVVLISDEHSRSTRIDLLQKLEVVGLECDDQGYIPLSGSVEEDVALALEARGIPRSGKDITYVFLSISGTSFSMYVNKIPSIICLAQGDPTTVSRELVEEVHPNAIEFANVQQIDIMNNVLQFIIN